MTKKSTVIAASVIGLFATATPALAHGGGGEKVKCQGINTCKGKGGCKTADNACKGQNGCKGKGWTMAKSEKDCTKKGGSVVAGDTAAPAAPEKPSKDDKK
jgi:hypothetical protein